MREMEAKDLWAGFMGMNCGHELWEGCVGRMCGQDVCRPQPLVPPMMEVAPTVDAIIELLVPIPNGKEIKT